MVERKKELPQRINWIDILRGFAILLMIPANLAPLWAMPHPMWFKIAGSYAAPIFIIVSTGMVMLNAHKYNFKYYLIRGSLIFTIGILLDLTVFRILPIYTFDILYLIGIALPITYLLRNSSTMMLILLGTLFLILAPMLHFLFGYQLQAPEIVLSNLYWPGFGEFIRNWFIDGWFPIIPWFCLVFFGAQFFRSIHKHPNLLILGKTTVVTIILLVISFLLLNQEQHFQILEHVGSLRSGYSEIFYPPTLPYMASSFAITFLMAVLAQFISRFMIANKIISVFGRYSLFIYILHQAIAMWIFSPIIEKSGNEIIASSNIFFIFVLTIIIICFLACLFIEWLKTFWKPKLILTQLLFGK